MTTKSPRRRMSSVQSSSPATLPLDITAPARVVQKQVIQICSNNKGCSTVLYMRLALPKSSKKRSYALFPEEEGIRLKSSAVYPVSVDKSGKTLLPQDASPALKRASRILAFGSNAPETPLASTFPETSNSDDSGNESSNKLVKPRITISNFQITVVSPQSKEEHTDTLEKLYYLAVVQIDVGLHRSPPTWPFEVHIPIPRCLNNKLQFTRDGEGTESDQRMVVDFEPALVQRSTSRPFENPSSLDVELEGNDSASLMEDVSQTVVSGSFPATNKIIARWAPVHAATDINQHVHSRSRYHPIRAHSLTSDGQVLSVTEVDKDYADISLRFHATLQGGTYPGLEPVAELELSLNSTSEFHWLNETLTVHSERSQTLHSWRTDGKEVSLMSRSSSMSITEPSSVDTDDSKASTAATTDLFTTTDEFASLIDVQPPKEVIESLQDDTSFDGSNNPEGLGLPSLLSPGRTRKISIGSHKSLASDYSQKSAASSDDTSLHLFLRTSAIREASAEGEDVAFFIAGKVRTRITEKEADGTFKAPCPLLIAAHLPSHASISSINDEIDLRGDANDNNRKSLVFDTDGSSIISKAVYLIGQPKSTSTDESLDEPSADYSTSTIGFANGRALHGNGRRKSLYHTAEDKFDELGLHTIVGEEVDNSAKHLDDWSGVIEDINTSVWITHGPSSASKRRKAVYRAQISWPYALNSVPIQSMQTEFVQQKPLLLPRLVLALLRASGDEKIDLLHAGIQGKPVQVAFDTQNCLEATSKSDATPSKMIDIRLPEYAQNTEGQVLVTLVYSVEGPSSSALNLLAPVASVVTYFHASIHDEALQDSVPILAYSSEPLSSSVQCDEQHHTAIIEASMLPSMTSVTMEYVKRTKPLVPLSSTPTAPLRRQSVVSNTSASIVAASLLPSVNTPEPKERSAPILSANEGQSVQLKQKQYLQEQQSHHLITWSTFHAFLLVILACCLYNVNFNVIPAVQQISRKVDVMGLALNLDFQHLQYSDPNIKFGSSQTDAKPSANNQLAVQQPYANSLSIPNSGGGISDFVTWLSLVLSWPLRRFLSIFAPDNH